jgi:hypothetical protein
MDEPEVRKVLDRAAAAVGHLPTALQPVAFVEAVRLLEGGSTGEEVEPAAVAPGSKRPTHQRRQTGTKKPRAKKRIAPSLDRSLDLHPKGKASLQAFDKEKAPQTQAEHNVVFVQYLQNIASVGAVTINQVYTCYREVSARIPSNLRNSLAVTSADKGWIESGDMENLSVTTRGENIVNLELPRGAKE